MIYLLLLLFSYFCYHSIPPCLCPSLPSFARKVHFRSLHARASFSPLLSFSPSPPAGVHCSSVHDSIQPSDSITTLPPTHPSISLWNFLPLPIPCKFLIVIFLLSRISRSHSLSRLLAFSHSPFLFCKIARFSHFFLQNVLWRMGNMRPGLNTN